MKKQKSLNQKRQRRARRVRARIKGTASKPRLSVFRSNSHVYAQLIDDIAEKTLASASSYKITKNSLKKTEVAKKVGEEIALKADKLGIKSVVLDRGEYRYHGRVKFLAEGARKKGLKI